MFYSYSEKELCAMWKRMEQSPKSIKVLSELTLLDRKEVSAILEKNGLWAGKNKEKIIEDSKKIKNKNMQICFMKHRGMTFNEIGQALGLSYGAVQRRYAHYRNNLIVGERV